MSPASQSTTASAETLGAESFMSAGELRSYMSEMRMAKASKEFDAMEKADRARSDLIKAMQERVDLTPQKLAQIKRDLAIKTRAAAERGESEVMVMRFPNALCTDHGRAINQSEAGWPETLTGRPRQAYELWKEQLQPEKYKLKAMIVEWPGGLPGDVAFFLSW
jgi:hypothetical protein